MLPLLVALAAVNGYHLYLVTSQRLARKETISEHAAKDSKTLLFYIVAHLIGAIGFGIFAYHLFWQQYHSYLLWGITLVGATNEIIQSFIPARGKTNSTHVVFAYTMAFSVLAASLVLPFALPFSVPVRCLVAVLGFCVLASMITVHRLHRKHFWLVQMIGTVFFHIEVVVVATALR